MKKIIQLIMIFFIGLNCVKVTAFNGLMMDESCSSSQGDGTEYWALLVGCNEFQYDPNAYLPGNDILAKDVRSQLLLSDFWQEDHIKVLTGKNATKSNILNGLRWLDRMDDEDDICLFMISTHGFNERDLFPYDELDKSDEYLFTYDYMKWVPGIGPCNFLRLSFLRDDELNFYLNRLDAKGVCAIIGSCSSGGFNDHVQTQFAQKDKSIFAPVNEKCSSSDWMAEVGKELSAPGRIVITSCEEYAIALGSGFERLLMEGLKGFSDTNNDDLCTAEEAFQYAAPITTKLLEREFKFRQIPQIYDNYPGELILTKCEYPPTHPEMNGPSKGETNKEYTYSLSAVDHEHDNITYYIDWGDGTEEWTDFYPSGEPVILHHVWDAEGTYNVRFKSMDEHGMEIYEIDRALERIVVSISDEVLIDQYQTTVYDQQHFNDVIIPNSKYMWLAQSFTPRHPLLSKIDLEAWVSLVSSSIKARPFHLSIRKELTGQDLTEVTVMPFQVSNHYVSIKWQWATFDFPDIEVIPGETYYIVIRFDQDGAFGGWLYAGLYYDNDPDYGDDPYPFGQPFYSEDGGRYWFEFYTIYDFNFVTYGK